MSNMKSIGVSHIIAGLTDADGGPSYSVPALSNALGDLNYDVKIRCVKSSNNILNYINGNFTVIQHRPDRFLFGLGRSSVSLFRALKQDANEGNILHAHGIWLLPNLYPALIKNRKPETIIVHSIRGMLSEASLQISKAKKKIMWHLCQGAAIKAADCLHATSLAEYEEIRAIGLRNPVAIIPNGIDISLFANHGRQSHQLNSQNIILSLGRLHPKKSLETLVYAWAKLEHQHPNWSMRIVGPSEVGYADQLKNLSHSLSLQRLSIEDAIYGDDKINALLNCNVFVLPTLNENFGMVVAEALAASVPVISTRGAPWAGLLRENCGWWIDHGVEPLTAALGEAINTPLDELRAMGLRGRDWMRRDFDWFQIAISMQQVYLWLKGDGPKPECVILD